MFFCIIFDTFLTEIVCSTRNCLCFTRNCLTLYEKRKNTGYVFSRFTFYRKWVKKPYLVFPMTDRTTTNKIPAATISHIIPPPTKKLPSGIPLAFKLSPASDAVGYNSATAMNNTTIKTNIKIHFSIVELLMFPFLLQSI